MSNKPVRTFREGAVGLSVWERQGKRGAFYDFTLSRSYKKGENGAGYTLTFREENAEAIVRVVSDAAHWMREQGSDLIEAGILPGHGNHDHTTAKMPARRP
jgi:hypothetical protein